MKQHTLWSRREFVQSIGCSSFAAAGLHVPWLTTATQPSPRFAYVGFSRAAQEPTGVRVFAIRGERWTHVQIVPSEHPTALALHPSQHFLYAVNEINSYQGLPLGTVEAYGIDPHDGHLTLLNRQPLSLSGTLPRHLAISPDGRNVVVALHGGGAYNVLPIGADGMLGKVSGILKEVGSGPNQQHQEASHPQTVIFDTAGRHLLGADLGSDRLNVFALDGDKLSIRDRSVTQPGSGPRHMVLHPAGHLLYVANHLEASLFCYGYDVANGKLRGQLHHETLSRNGSAEMGLGALAIHPSGQFLYASYRPAEPNRPSPEGIVAWRINPTTGALTSIQLSTEESPCINTMTMLPDGTGLLALSLECNSVVHLSINPVSGRLGAAMQVAKVSAPISLAVKYA